ncbi:trypsin-like peptidase domain-containing protein [Bacillus taeanensis]|uniref:FHA domain-containing protein n=1 Tax=Bacillus taeanensis TaxID=273032 RepID=A0A366XW11_9BACI|nr:trypsin-like peptidase domain-containing protein [Bacillus taeanensis]RBW68949.1 hypothetical protein DS031_13485 [Bacillus taeanensis]
MKIQVYQKSLWRVTLLIVLGLLAMFLFKPHSAQTKEIDELVHSVVRILCFTNDGTGQYYTGSGFAIGTNEPVQYIVTNYHVVEPNMNGVTILLSKEDQIPAEVVAFDRVKDITVLKLSEDLYKRPPVALAPSETVKPSEEVYALGFPGAADLIDDTPSGEAGDVTITRGIVSKISEEGGRKIFQIDANISGGNSGGPLVNKDGYVIGINTFGVQGVSGINGAVQINELIPLLDSRGIPYQLASNLEIPHTEPNNNESHSFGWLWILLLVGGSLLFLILIVVLLLFIMKGNKKQKNANPLPSQAPPAVKKPILVGISGYFAGMTIRIENTTMIGRDPNTCQLVYPLSQDDISRTHCTVRFEASSETFFVEDHSYNGTFLRSGERFSTDRGYQLKSGDRFYLVTPEQMFEVRLEKQQ